MSLNVEIDSWDYNQAEKAVDKLLSKIRAVPVSDEEATIEDLPLASEIVDLVWDCIR